MALQKVVNPKFDNPIWGIPANVIQYLFGYVNILIGAVGTILLQSSSIFTSTLTPMVGVGLVEVETVYPLFLGKTFNQGRHCQFLADKAPTVTATLTACHRCHLRFLFYKI